MSAPMSSLLPALGEFAASLASRPLPPEVLHHAKRAVIDWTACTVAGAGAAPARLMEEAFAEELDHGPSRLMLGRPAGSGVAALINGTAAHTVEFDDIYKEAETFDRCAGHPQNTGVYHYHAEPTSLSYDDDRFIGVMRDGSPIYGRRDSDGAVPTDLDAAGGHTGATPDSATAVYHYHVNLQTSSTPGTAGEQQWFITTGEYHSATGTCTGCN
jgi:hypothetical protein